MLGTSWPGSALSRSSLVSGFFQELLLNKVLLSKLGIQVMVHTLISLMSETREDSSDRSIAAMWRACTLECLVPHTALHVTQRFVQSSFLGGIPDLDSKSAKQISEANILTKFAVSIMRLCRSRGIPFTFENPTTSKIWKLPSIQDIAAKPHSRMHAFHMCQFGTRWRKPTTVMSWRFPELDRIEQRCSGEQLAAAPTYHISHWSIRE